jgi:hypothetical protein
MNMEIPPAVGDTITLEQAQREILRLLETESEIAGMSLFEKRVSEYYKKKNSEKEKREGVADYALVASKNFRREMIESWFRKFSDAEFKLLEGKIEFLWLKVLKATVKKPSENLSGDLPEVDVRITRGYDGVIPSNSNKKDKISLRGKGNPGMDYSHPDFRKKDSDDL